MDGQTISSTSDSHSPSWPSFCPAPRAPPSSQLTSQASEVQRKRPSQRHVSRTGLSQDSQRQSPSASPLACSSMSARTQLALQVECVSMTCCVNPRVYEDSKLWRSRHAQYTNDAKTVCLGRCLCKLLLVRSCAFIGTDEGLAEPGAYTCTSGDFLR